MGNPAPVVSHHFHGAKRPVLVAALPARKNRRSNPFQYLLYSALEPLGYAAEEFEKAIFRVNRVAVVHLHWPDGAVLHASLSKTLRRLVVFFSILCTYKLCRVPIVWTAHNTRSHDGHHPRLEGLLWSCLYPLLDAVICLKPLEREQALLQNPALRGKRFVQIPHGEFGSYYRKVRCPSSDSCLGNSQPPPHTRQFLIFGLIRAYKRIPEAIQAFQRHADPDAGLLIAGRCLEPEISAEIADLAAADSRIEIQDRYIEPAEIADLFERIHALVLTQSPEKNSGVLHLAASFGVPVVFADRTIPNWDSPFPLPPPPAWPELAAAHARLFGEING